MNILLRLKHWQLLLLSIALAFLFRIGSAILLFPNKLAAPAAPLFTLILFLVFALSWFYALGNHLHKRLPAEEKFNILKYSLLLLSIALLAIGFGIYVVYFLRGSNIKAFNPVIIILPLIAIASVGFRFCTDTISRAFKTVELKRHVEQREYTGDRLLFTLFPLGVWSLQPRINDLYRNTTLKKRNERGPRSTSSEIDRKTFSPYILEAIKEHIAAKDIKDIYSLSLFAYSEEAMKKVAAHFHNREYKKSFSVASLPSTWEEFYGDEGELILIRDNKGDSHIAILYSDTSQAEYIPPTLKYFEATHQIEDMMQFEFRRLVYPV